LFPLAHSSWQTNIIYTAQLPFLTTSYNNIPARCFAVMTTEPANYQVSGFLKLLPTFYPVLAVNSRVTTHGISFLKP